MVDPGFHIQVRSKPSFHSSFSVSDTSVVFSGSAVVRFELSTLPEHSGSQQVVVRCLKFQDPVTCVIPNYDGWVPLPQEGELLYRRRPLAFSTDQDTPRSRVLKYLLEDHLQRSVVHSQQHAT
jgi:hypothetical protein